jgi:hypothetical protein
MREGEERLPYYMDQVGERRVRSLEFEERVQKHEVDCKEFKCKRLPLVQYRN